MPTLPAALDRLAASQHGLLTLDQCRTAGLASTTLGDWAGRGWMARMQPGVNRVWGAPATTEQLLLACVLAAGPGAAASHREAASLWELVRDATLEVVVPRGRNPRLASAAVHRSRDPFVVVHRRGIPVTSPMRALVDLAAVVDRPDQVEEALDRGLAAGLFTVAAVEWELARVARPGRAGAGRLRRLLDRRALDAAPPDGLLEPRFARLLRGHGLAPAAFQHEVRWRGRRYRIDFAYPERGVAIEVDGYQARATRAAFQHDTERQTALAALGWTVLRFTWHDVVRRPAYVAATVAAVSDARPPSSGHGGAGMPENRCPDAVVAPAAATAS